MDGKQSASSNINAHNTAEKIYALSSLSMFAISLLIFCYFFCICVWIAPSSQLRSALLKKVAPILTVTGLEQQWNLFGPEVRKINLHGMAIITFADGSMKLYEFPRMDKLDIWRRLKREKMRKMFVERIPTDNHRDFLPAICRSIACANANPDNQPVEITLAYNWCNIPPPDPEHWAPRESLPEHDRHQTLCVYRVKTGDLQ